MKASLGDVALLSHIAHKLCPNDLPGGSSSAPNSTWEFQMECCEILVMGLLMYGEQGNFTLIRARWGIVCDVVVDAAKAVAETSL